MLNSFRRTLRGLLALMVVFGLSAGASAHAQDDPVRDVFTVVTSESSETQMMAMVLSNQALNKGAEVRVLLCDGGGTLGIRDEQFPSFAPAERTPQQLLGRLIDEGATVEVCAIFLPNSEYSEADLIDGVGIAKPSPVADYMLREDVKHFTF